MNKIFNYCLIFLFSSVPLPAQYISVDTNYDANQLVKDVFFGGVGSSCISVDNASISGYDFGSGNKSYGYFNKNGSSFEMQEGIILSTGSALQAVGPNNFIQTEKRTDPFAERNWGGDPDLIETLNNNSLNSDNILNATILEFDFVSLKYSEISFEYMFLSEEYRRHNCDYSDAFAFLIKKKNTTDPYQNIATVPGTTTPVSTTTINASQRCPMNVSYFGSFNEEETPTNFNGQTKTLTAKARVDVGTTYHIKLVIADHGDTTGLFDSAVFLKGGSFVGSKDLGQNHLITDGTALCDNTIITLDASTPGATYIWYKDGVAIPGANSANYVVTENGYYEVNIDDSGCQLKGSIRIEFSERPNVSEKKFCNDNNGAPIQLNLQDLNDQFISNNKDYFEVKYFADSAHTDLLPDNFSYTDDTIIYSQVKSGNCPPANATLHLNTPKKSVDLVDQTICPNATTTLKAETGFKHYRWMKENGEIIAEGDMLNEISDILVGKYKVELTSQNDCTMEQEVTVYAAQLPEITNIDVTGNTATVYVSGGNPGYEYSIDDTNFTSSNIFTDIPRGLHTIFVRDSKKCEIIEKQFLVINLINVITPNNDGFNDVLDYSDLKIKENVRIEIFDRYGNMVFQSSDKNYLWDGTTNGKALPTGNYWYILNWIEPDTKLPVSYKGWILLKNRN